MACLLVLYISDKDILCIVYFFSLHFILNLFISFFTFLSVFFLELYLAHFPFDCFHLFILFCLRFFFIYFFLCLFSSNSLLLAIACAGLCLLVKFFFFFFFCCVLKAIRYHLILYQTFLSLSLSFFCFCLIILMESPARTN